MASLAGCPPMEFIVTTDRARATALYRNDSGRFVMRTRLSCILWVAIALTACSQPGGTTSGGETTVDGPIVVSLEYQGLGAGGIQLVGTQYVKSKDHVYVLHFTQDALQLVGMDRQKDGDATLIPMPAPHEPLPVYLKATYRVRGNILDRPPPLPAGDAQKSTFDLVSARMDERAKDAEFARLNPMEQLQRAGAEIVEEQMLRDVPASIDGLPTRILQPTYLELVTPEAGHAT